jgi:hypothetical protein
VIFLFPSHNNWHEVLRARVADILSYVPLLIVFVVIPFFFLRAPYLIHQEQEKKIGEMNKELDTRAAIRSLCERLAVFNSEGANIQKKCTSTKFPGKEIKGWLNKVEKYLKTLDPIHLDDWMDESGISRLEGTEQKGSNKEERDLYQVFVFRLTRLQMVASELRGELRRRVWVSHETNSTIS